MSSDLGTPRTSDACESFGQDLPPRARALGLVAWCSFLTASAASVVVFAFVDPELLGYASARLWWLDRLTGYALGFFAFWLATAASAGLTLYMVRTERAPPEKP